MNFEYEMSPSKPLLYSTYSITYTQPQTVLYVPGAPYVVRPARPRSYLDFEK